MKQFIDKLIERLEEHKTKAYVTGFTNNPYELGACHAMDDAVKIVNLLAEEYNTDIPALDVNELFKAVEQNDISTDLMIVSSLPSLYPLQDFEEEAVHRVVAKNATVGGWIPCSERFPEIDGCISDTVLVCGSNGFQYMAFWCDDLQWRFCECGMAKEPVLWTEIVAWQPLPQPYQPKGE